MKALLVLGSMLMLGIVVTTTGCGQKQASPDKPPAEVRQAESMDSTAMDSAAVELMPADSMAPSHDSM